MQSNKSLGVGTLGKKFFIILLILIQFIFMGCQPKEENSQQDKAPEFQENQSPSDEVVEEEEERKTVEDIRLAIADSPYLDKTHLDNGVSCDDCHGTINEGEDLVIPDDQVCLDCHGSYEDLAKVLAEKEHWQRYNPHYPAHERDQCISCHKSHSSFELTCSSCHSISDTNRFP